jgi:diacylglycerol kinase (ATP)
MRKIIKSFGFAFKGLWLAVSTQRNMQIHLLAVVLITSAGFYFQISAYEWIAVSLCFALVISLEMINTAIEIFADKLHPEKNEQIGKVKDIAAGAVLVAAIFAVVVAGLVFGKYLLVMLK